ncbi:HEPN domain-containing protein [Candidatus Micrarchaeota archaeon]|nr:HEPN domain-containing protein [Candidatus Micrarchaeota archaeon]
MELDIQRWIKKAESDLDTAKYNFDGERYDAAAFYSQQAAEKALKAIYIKKLNSLLKVHDLVQLARKINAPEKIIEVCKFLTSFYIETRYPGLALDINEEEASDALKDSKMVIEWVKKTL